MVDAWNNLCVTLLDPVLGWVLHLPADLALLVVSLLSALLLVAARWFTTNQDHLGRVDADKKRLKELSRQARAAGDQDALQRYKITKAALGLMALRAEGKPLLLAILPLMVLATWAFMRLEFHSPRDGEELTAVAYLPVTAVSAQDPAHLVPPADHGLVSTAWVQPVRDGHFFGQVTGKAVWKIKAAAAPQPHRLVFRFRDETYEHPLLVGQATYTPSIVYHNDQVATAVEYRERKFLGLVPGVPPLSWLPGLGAGIPAWIIGYMLVVVPGMLLLKKLLRTY